MSIMDKLLEVDKLDDSLKNVWRIEKPKVERVSFNECLHTYGEEKDDDLLKTTTQLYLEQENLSEVKMTDMKYHGYIMGNLVGIGDDSCGGYYILCDDNTYRAAAAKEVKHLN